MSRALFDLTATELRNRVAARDVSCEEVVTAHLDRLAAVEPRIGAFLLPLPERALQKARRQDSDLAGGGEAGALAGVPVVVKDVLDIQDIPTTCGSRILEGYTPPFTATAISRLEEAGAVVIGKSNMDEFAMGSSNEEQRPFRPTSQPLGHVPSIPRRVFKRIGSAASVAASLCAAPGLGNRYRWLDPPACCDVRCHGHRNSPYLRAGEPFWDRSPLRLPWTKSGPMAYAPSMDVARLLSKSSAGVDPHDDSPAPRPRGAQPTQADLDQRHPPRACALGIPKELSLIDGIEAEDPRTRFVQGLAILDVRRRPRSRRSSRSPSPTPKHASRHVLHRRHRRSL